MNDDQLLRYSRHILLPHFDIDGQQRLLDSRVIIIGLGGLGSPVAMYLAAAGVGHLVLVDDDVVELSNLQRQIVHRQAAVGLNKTDSAAQTLQQLNDSIIIDTIAARLTENQLAEQLTQADIVVDCTDNFASRFMINRVCQQQLKPMVSAAAIRWEGQISVFDPRQPDAACYRCLYDDATGELVQNCADSGVLSPLLGIMGSLQATETLKLLANCGESLQGRLLLVDAFHLQIREIFLKPDPACPVCHSTRNNNEP